jgi:hypothetical protein
VRGPSGEDPEGPKEANDDRDPPPDPDTAGALGNAAAIADARRIAHPTAIARPCRFADPAEVATNGDGEMMIPGGVRDRPLGSAVPTGAADVGREEAPSAEEAHLPFAGGVLDEVVRIQRARRAAEPARVVPRYLPTSARSGATKGDEGEWDTTKGSGT